MERAQAWALAAFDIHLAYGLILIPVAWAFPILLEVWNHGGIWHRHIFLVPLLAILARLSVWAWGRKRAAAIGLLVMDCSWPCGWQGFSSGRSLQTEAARYGRSRIITEGHRRMSLTIDLSPAIDLSPETEATLRAQAEAAGVSAEALAAETLGRAISAQAAAGGAPPLSRSVSDVIRGIWSDMPEDVRKKLPRDGPSEHDHYIYGWPKRGE